MSMSKLFDTEGTKKFSDILSRSNFTIINKNDFSKTYSSFKKKPGGLFKSNCPVLNNNQSINISNCNNSYD
jgi:hypothetical protein